MRETTLVEQYDSDLVKRTQGIICFVILTRLVALCVFDFLTKAQRVICLWTSLKCRSRLIGKSIFLHSLFFFFVFLCKHSRMRMGVRVGLQCAYSCWPVSIHHVWSENRMVISPRQAQLTDCSVRHPSTLQSPTTRLSQDYRTYHHSARYSSVFIALRDMERPRSTAQTNYTLS